MTVRWYVVHTQVQGEDRADVWGELQDRGRRSTSRLVTIARMMREEFGEYSEA